MEQDTLRHKRLPTGTVPFGAWYYIWGSLALLATVAALLAPSFSPVARTLPDWFLYLAAAALAGALVLGPPKPITCLYLLTLISGHESLSFFTIQGLGVEWHPREMLLMVALAHVGVQVLRCNLTVVESPVHYFTALYGLFFAIAFVAGLYYAQDYRPLIGESRFALMLLAYPLFLSSIRTRQDARWYAGFCCVTALSIATLGLLFFVYAQSTGAIISVHTLFGAFIRRNIGGLLIQTVRPNGNMLFESSALVLISLLAGARLNGRNRFLVATALMLFLTAILITFMRTAYLSLTLSLFLLAWLWMPPPTRIFSAAVVACAGAVTAACGVTLLFSMDAPPLHLIEVSVRARLVETLGGWELFMRHPLLGGGMGASFEALGLVGQKAHISYTQTEYVTVHNFFLYVLMKGGMVGSLLVLTAFSGILWHGMRTADRLEDGFDRALIRGMTAAFFGQCLASAAMTRFYFPLGQTFIAFVAVLLYVYAQPDKKKTCEVVETTSQVCN